MKIEKTKNKNPKFGSKGEYYVLGPIKVEGEKEKVWLMFTKKEIEVAKERALKNPEDLPKKWWRFW